MTSNKNKKPALFERYLLWAVAAVVLASGCMQLPAGLDSVRETAADANRVKLREALGVLCGNAYESTVAELFPTERERAARAALCSR